MLIAKDNQATLADDLRLFFTEPPHDCRDWRTARTVNKGHGRLEIRELVASTELNAFLGGQWAGEAGVFQVTRTVYEDGQMRREAVYGITSLSPTRASAARLLALLRAHWRIEIVQSQMTKTNGFPFGGGWNHIADLHLLPGNHNTVN